ncbi:MAG: DUF3551 domain-containing protein [Xanthobacteraceae bacterium]|nr:DUF3551 domain-containing protein [Xanthobacteraceae bacterium]
MAAHHRSHAPISSSGTTIRRTSDEDDPQGRDSLNNRTFNMGIGTMKASPAQAGPIVPPGHDCLSYDHGGTNCSFTSYAQCLATASGLAPSAMARPFVMMKAIPWQPRGFFSAGTLVHFGT